MPPPRSSTTSASSSAPGLSRGNRSYSLMGALVAPTVRFPAKEENLVTLVVRLPIEEAEDARRARKGPWKAAPPHDELWDGDIYDFREQELTPEQLKELLRVISLQSASPSSPSKPSGSKVNPLRRLFFNLSSSGKKGDGRPAGIDMVGARARLSVADEEEGDAPPVPGSPTILPPSSAQSTPSPVRHLKTTKFEPSPPSEPKPPSKKLGPSRDELEEARQYKQAKRLSLAESVSTLDEHLGGSLARGSIGGGGLEEIIVSVVEDEDGPEEAPEEPAPSTPAPPALLPPPLVVPVAPAPAEQYFPPTELELALNAENSKIHVIDALAGPAAALRKESASSLKVMSGRKKSILLTRGRSTKNIVKLVSVLDSTPTIVYVVVFFLASSLVTEVVRRIAGSSLGWMLPLGALLAGSALAFLASPRSEPKKDQ